MIGVIERIKNNVLLKCSTLNDDVITGVLDKIVDASIYHFAEDLISMVNGINVGINEESIRHSSDKLIKELIAKKIKRKLFIDSLALQITNDSFIEDYANKRISLESLRHDYIKELKNNENSNQLNMTEDLNLNEIFEGIYLYVNKNIISSIKENDFLVKNVNLLVDKTKNDLESNLEEMVNDIDNEYLNILLNELNAEIKEEVKEEKGDANIMENTNYNEVEAPTIVENNKFDKYDDMTLFNKLLLSLNTKEEKLTRKENKQAKRNEEINSRLADANSNIQTNIERENILANRSLSLNSREVELNSKLSEAEVIFLNMKPLIKGLNSIKASDEGGSNNE